MNEHAGTASSVTTATGDAATDTAGKHGAGSSGASKGRVLIVEDESGLADVLALHLEAAGYETAVATDGLAALYELDRSEVRAVLLDLHLPQVSGFRLMQLLKQRANAPQLPVLVITALNFQEAEEVVRGGADDFITKPFMPAEVVTRVDRMLARIT